jgi:hypothetical protein
VYAVNAVTAAEIQNQTMTTMTMDHMKRAKGGGHFGVFWGNVLS